MPGGGGETWMEELSSEPRASLYHNFLVSTPHVAVYQNLGIRCKHASLIYDSDWMLWYLVLSQSKEECNHLISLAKPRLKKSRVVDAETGGTKESRLHCIQWTLPKQRQFLLISGMWCFTSPVTHADYLAWRWLHAACGQVQGCFWKEGRTRLFVGSREGLQITHPYP